MMRRILVGDNERVLVIRKRRFENILGPGEYWLFTLGVKLVRVNATELVFVGEWADFIVTQKPELAARYFTVVETNDAQVAVVVDVLLDLVLELFGLEFAPAGGAQNGRLA